MAPKQGRKAGQSLQLAQLRKGEQMLYMALYYVVAITILVLHFTGFLARRNLEWLVLVLAVSVFPAVIYL